jgi:O-antigen biosynthesis protein WbqP
MSNGVIIHDVLLCLNFIGEVLEMYKAFLKRVIDVVLSLGGITVLLLPMLIIAVAIKIDSKGPVLFKQKRVGKDKKYFYILKFRTMMTETPPDVPTDELSDPERWVTRVGRFLRMTSLDELPQLFNILAGHMSVIGPRPALWNQLDLIEERDKYGANGIRPGLSGWAQVNGRDKLNSIEKARFDGEYVKRLGFAFDVKCVLKTLKCIFTQN